MVTENYIKHEMYLLEQKEARKRNGLLFCDKKRYECLQNALKYIQLHSAFNQINNEFNNAFN